MPIDELFIVEYLDGDIDYREDFGGFTVFERRRDAEEAIDCLEDTTAKVVRFVREAAAAAEGEEK